MIWIPPNQAWAPAKKNPAQGWQAERGSNPRSEARGSAEDTGG